MYRYLYVAIAIPGSVDTGLPRAPPSLPGATMYGLCKREASSFSISFHAVPSPTNRVPFLLALCALLTVFALIR